MSQRSRGLAACALLATMPMAASAADSIDVLRYALSGGTPNVDVRARYEHAEQDNALTLANAYTVRARLGYTTGKWNDLDLLTEFEGTFPFGPEAYNSGTNGKTTRVTIADPKGTELNQFMLRYSGLTGNVFKLGRQRLLLDTQRFVGNVGWRQNEVTFDSATWVNTQLAKTTVSASYLARVNTVSYTGYQLNGYLFNAAYAPVQEVNVVAYAYLLDFSSTSPGATSCTFAASNTQQRVIQRCDSQTYGLRESGTIPLDPVKLLYAIEVAHQNHYKDAPGAVSAPYYLGEFGATAYGVTAKLGYEVMGGDGVYGFQTPLATLHAFDGWADMFLNTPIKGLRDAYLRAEGDVPFVGVKLLGFYHDFRSDSGRDKLGTELDVQAVKSINDSFSVMLKLAQFNSSTNLAPFVDTRKLWAQAEYKF
jgi:hypothetical protein